jgi:hypothetical protein
MYVVRISKLHASSTEVDNRIMDTHPLSRFRDKGGSTLPNYCPTRHGSGKRLFPGC